MDAGHRSSGSPHAGAPTLESVAALAGVSRATAGRVLSGSPRVSAAATKAVRNAAKELSYVPNRAARSLVTRRSDSIAFVVAEDEARVFADPFFPAVLRGAHQAVSDAELQLVFVVVSTAAEHEQFYRFAAGGHVDGAVFVSLHGDDRLPQRLRDVGVPSVLSGRPFRADDDIPHVDADNLGGARLATRALVDAGSRRLATVAGPLDMPAAQDRLSGFLAEVADAGGEVAPEHIVHGDFTPDSGYAATRRLLAGGERPDGVFVANDTMAVGALRALREAGLDVPAHVRVVGFDDSPVAAASHPALTTVRQPMEQLGREMATLVMALVAGTAAPRSVVLPTQLVRRATC